MIILILGLVLMPFLRYFVKSDIPPDVSLYVLYLIYLANTVLSYFLFAYKNSLLTAHQRNDVASNIATLTCLFQNLLEIAALLVFRNYYCYAVVIPIMTVVSNCIRSWYVDRMFPQYVCEGHIGREETASLKKQVSGLLASRIGDIVLTNVDTIVISAFLGLTVLGKYNDYYYIITSLFGILGMINSSIIPSVGNTVFTKNKKDLISDYQKFSFLYITISSWFSVCFLCLVQPFIELWIGSGNLLDFPMAVWMAVYLYTSKINDMTYVYRQATGLWWEGRWIPLVSAIFNLIINLILVQIIGLPGIVISTVLSRVLIMLPAGSHNIFRCYFHDMGEWKTYMAYQVFYGLSTAAAAGVTYSICMCVTGGLWRILILRAVICVFLPLSVFLVFNCWNRPFRLSKEYISSIWMRVMKAKRG